MSLDQVKFLRRTQCGLYPDSTEDCSRFWVLETRTSDFESGLGDFDVKYCTACKMGFTDPFPTEETSGYLYEKKTSGDFDLIQKSSIDKIKDWLGRRLLRKISHFPNFSDVRHVLDYACGNGRFSSLATDVFPAADVTAVDYQETPPAIFSAGHRARLSYVTVAEFGGMNQQYDLIILRHVLEHTHRPVELLRLLASRLKSQGILYIEVPNLRAGGARILRSKWKAYYVPRHIFHYTAESLFTIVALAGLRGKVETTETPLMGNTLSILLHLKKENRVIQFLGIFLHPLQLAIEFVFRSSTCLCVTARLPSAANP